MYLNKAVAYLTVLMTLCFSVRTAAQNVEKEDTDAAIENTVEEIALVLSGWSGGLKRYQVDLLSHLVEQGPMRGAKIKVIELDFNTLRSLQPRKTDDRYIVNFTSGWSQHTNESSYISDYAYLNNLLGIRRCIILSSRLQDFKKIRTVDDLRQYKVGQGIGWPDNLIYQAAGITVVEAMNLKYLNGMLLKKRFDCVPLGTIEVDDFVSNKSAAMTYDSLFLIYPQKMRLVSNSHKLGRVLESTFVKEKKRGNIAKILNRHFGDTSRPDLLNSIVLYLPTPELSKERNQREIQKIKQLYKLP